MTLLAINWSNVGLQVAELLLALSILIVLHEFGHFITARWFKCKVEKFFLFFDPWFALVKKKVGDTVYGIGWLPLGGYVKIAGMIDESMDKEQMKLPPKPDEFRSKPAWQRLIIMLGGVIMNILTAFVIYAFVLMIWGESKTPNATVKNGIWVRDSVMTTELGFHNGDKIIAVNGDTVRYFEDLSQKIIIGGKNVLIQRNGKDTLINLSENTIGKIIKKGKRRMLFVQRLPTISGDYKEKDTSFAKRAGLKEFDNIIAVNGEPVAFMDQLAEKLSDHKNDSVQLAVLRGSDTLQLRSRVSDEGTIGITGLSEQQYDSLGYFTVVTKKYGFFQAFPAGVRLTGEKLGAYIDQFKMILNPKTEAYKGLGGFKTIASIFPTGGWDWEGFWNITAFLSIVLAVMNLLPIPGLDGGHVLFTLYEIITRRKPSDKFLEYAQIVGFVIILALMLYANGNDWFGWGRR